MADTKITALNALAVAVGSDILPIVDDPAGAPETKKITLSNLFASILQSGTIYVDDGSTAQTGIGTSPVLLANFAVNGASSAGVTPDFANNKITLANAGTYLVLAVVSFSGSNNATFHFHAYLDAVEQTQAGMKRKLSTGGDIGAAPLVGIVTATAGQEVTIRVNADAAGKSLTLDEAALVVVRLS